MELYTLLHLCLRKLQERQSTFGATSIAAWGRQMVPVESGGSIQYWGF